jgi:hypothetical protein
MPGPIPALKVDFDSPKLLVFYDFSTALKPTFWLIFMDFGVEAQRLVT